MDQVSSVSIKRKRELALSCAAYCFLVIITAAGAWIP
ncbi:hypothetical protein HDF14_003246 [Edaphobacter lichenicola]|uniref:Uncharacterized protein n=1 Tax=Tunturiibacter gelidiferens TaxID=3069689 RepID=A0A9X0QG56_9BACT|nr:hypothetical protein [Edaphobacter lichenicola]